MFKKAFIFSFLGVFFISGFTFAQQPKKLPIPGIFSTGVDNNKLPLADGEDDPHYFLSLSADASFPGPYT